MNTHADLNELNDSGYSNRRLEEPQTLSTQNIWTRSELLSKVNYSLYVGSRDALQTVFRIPNTV